MTLPPADRAWREEQSRCKPSSSQLVSKRFMGKNAIVDCGVVAALTTSELRVLFVIERFLDAAGKARISHTTIASLVGMRREHVARTTARLERRGLLRVLERGRRVRESGKRTANVYELVAPPPTMNGAAHGTIADTE
jgi:CRP-like cAMP-binding protein